MKKRIVTLVVFLLIACMALTGCSSEGSKVENTAAPETATVETTEEPQDSDGMYEWTVRGVTLRTKTNIMDYIKGKVWNSVALAESLGLVNINDNPSFRQAIGFKNNDFFVRFHTEHTNDPSGRDIFCYGIWYANEDNINCDVLFLDMLQAKATSDYWIDYYNAQDTISFEGIVVFTYACEHLVSDPGTDPFSGVFPERENGKYAFE